MPRRNAFAVAARSRKGGAQRVSDVREERAPGHHTVYTSGMVGEGVRLWRPRDGRLADVIQFSGDVAYVEYLDAPHRLWVISSEELDREWEIHYGPGRKR